MSSMYKFYTMILVERLREEVEGKGVSYYRLRQILGKGWEL